MSADDGDRILLIGTGPVTLSLDKNGIGELTLNTPETANCLNREMLTAIENAVGMCRDESRLRVLILSGAGRNFCAGGDIKTFVAKGSNLPEYVLNATQQLANVVRSMIELQVPIIASVQGFAAGGGGFGIVCAADIVIASDSAKFLAGATRVGMAPDAGLSVTLQNLVGFRQAMSILLTNPTISADEAMTLGIVTDVVPDAELGDQTSACAEELAIGAPLALRETKRLLWNGMGLSVESVLDDESKTVSMLSGTTDSMEAMIAILEKREANFVGK